MGNLAVVGLSRQVALERQLDVVSNNVANINTTGYKADGAMFQEFMGATARAGNLTGGDSRIRFVIDGGIWHDMSPGSIQQTGNPLDVAIDGEGFLAVQTPAGERYTRNGALQINAAGQLVTNEGMPVLGENGPITLQNSDHNIIISQDGRVSVNEANVSRTEGYRGKLRVVTFARPQDLQKDGSSNFQAPDGVTPQPIPVVKVQQGALEKSNVNSVLEMTRLIDITRSYTEVSNLLQQQSDLHRSAIQQLADVPA